jgi:DNA-directed RNA polymerase subunit RPC12/RpoP
MKAVTTYSADNIIEQELVDAEIHCPECGVKNVQVETCDGDYYLGPTYYCLSCKHEFGYHSWGQNKKTVIHEG